MKIIFMLSIALGLISCNQPFSEAEKEILKDTANEVVKDMDNNQKTATKENNKPKYGTPFCELLTVAAIKKIVPDAEGFAFKAMEQKTPECRITFQSGNMIGNRKSPAGIIIKGFNPRKGETARTFLERQIATNTVSQKIEGLGDEAYLFPFDMNTSIVVIKNNLSYYLRLNRYGENNQEQAIELMHVLIDNVK